MTRRVPADLYEYDPDLIAIWRERWMQAYRELPEEQRLAPGERPAQPAPTAAPPTTSPATEAAQAPESPGPAR